MMSCSQVRSKRRVGIVLSSFGLALLAGALNRPTAAQPAEEAEYAPIMALASSSLLLDGAAVDDLMVVVGERGHILTSRDQGASWAQARVPTRATLTAVHLHDENLGWAVGHDALILRTRDGGATWEILNHEPEQERPFLDVWFADESNGIAIGAYGFYFRTTDGGDTWDDLDFEISNEEVEEEDEEYYGGAIDYHLNHIVPTDDGGLYIAAEAGNVYRSDDGGETWLRLPSPYEGSFFGSLPLEDDSLLLFGLRGNLFRTDDGGETWAAIDTGTNAMLTNAVQLSDGTVLVTGLAGVILASHDGGRTFTLEQQPDRQALSALLPTSDGKLVLIGEFGVSSIPIDSLREVPSP
jgi:photosystem II stability/assembly factor-like uncharacterized protein